MATISHLLLGIIVVGGSEEVPEDKGRHVHVMFLVHLYRNTLTVVHYDDLVLLPGKMFCYRDDTRLSLFINSQRNYNTVRSSISVDLKLKRIKTHGDISILILFMLGSRCLLSDALTRISSKILYKPGRKFHIITFDMCNRQCKKGVITL